MRLIVVLDCADADALADFWSAALGFRRDSFDPPYVRLSDPAKRWPDLLLQQVPEAKSTKNRMHLDIHVPDVSAEVMRLTALGASVLESPHDDGGFLTAVLADPQGNEFCVIKPPPRATSNRIYYWRSGAIDAEAFFDDNDTFDEAGAADAAADLAAQLDAGKGDAAQPHPAVRAFRTDVLDLRPTLAGAVGPDADTPDADRYVVIDMTDQWAAFIDLLILAKRHQMDFYDASRHSTNLG